MTCPPPSFPWSGSSRKSPQCQIHVSSHHLRISRGRGRRGMLPQSHSSTGNVSSFFPPAAAEEEETIFYRSIIQEFSFFSFLLAMSSFSFLLSHPPTILSVSFSALPPLFLLLLPHFSPLRQKKFTEGGRRRDGFVGAREWYECCCSGKRRGGGPTNGNLPNDGPSSPPPAVGGRQLFLLRSQSCF